MLKFFKSLETIMTHCEVVKHFLWYFHALYSVSISILTIVPLLVSIAFFTLAERKIMASIQRRRGPNVVGV